MNVHVIACNHYMKLKTLLLLILLVIAGYFVYDFATTQFSPTAMAYKRYAQALLDGDISRARTKVLNKDALIPFAAEAERREFIGGRLRFVWFDVVEERASADGQTKTLIVNQILRVDPEGYDSFFGTEVKRDRHVVVLVKDRAAWKIKSFSDSATRSHRIVN